MAIKLPKIAIMVNGLQTENGSIQDQLVTIKTVINHTNLWFNIVHEMKEMSPFRSKSLVANLYVCERDRDRVTERQRQRERKKERWTERECAA